MANPMCAVRGPFTAYPQYRFYRPGMPPGPQAMMQNSGMPPTFYYSVPGAGATGLNRPPPTPLMQARTFHRAASVPVQTQAGPQGTQQQPQQQGQGQAIFSPAYIATTIQPLSLPGRGKIHGMYILYI